MKFVCALDLIGRVWLIGQETFRLLPVVSSVKVTLQIGFG